MTQIHEPLNDLISSNSTYNSNISPALNSYLAQINQLNIPQYLQYSDPNSNFQLGFNLSPQPQNTSPQQQQLISMNSQPQTINNPNTNTSESSLPNIDNNGTNPQTELKPVIHIKQATTQINQITPKMNNNNQPQVNQMTQQVNQMNTQMTQINSMNSQIGQINPQQIQQINPQQMQQINPQQMQQINPQQMQQINPKMQQMNQQMTTQMVQMTPQMQQMNPQLQQLNPQMQQMTQQINPQMVNMQMTNNGQFSTQQQQQQPQQFQTGQPNDHKRHRRSKHEQQGRDFACGCGKSFLSQVALNNHIKTKHPELLAGTERRGRGRPRKYPKTESSFETTKYESFFHLPKRMCEQGVMLNIPNIVQTVFNFIYNGNYKDKLFSHPQNYTENFILDNLVKDTKLPQKQKSETSCDEAFYEYLSTFKSKTNDKYFSFLLKFILLFKECYDVHKNKNATEENKQQYTSKISPEELPDLCNEFYGEFLDQNNFFGIEDQDDRNEIIETIQHFCMWLFKNDYTKSKLSLASG